MSSSYAVVAREPTEVARDPVLHTYLTRISSSSRSSRNRATHSQHTDLLPLLDAPLPLQLGQDPFRAIVPNPLVPLLVLAPHLHSNVHHPPRQLLPRAPLADRQGSLRLDPRKRLKEVDGRRAGGEEVGGTAEDEGEELVGVGEGVERSEEHTSELQSQ